MSNLNLKTTITRAETLTTHLKRFMMDTRAKEIKSIQPTTTMAIAQTIKALTVITVGTMFCCCILSKISSTRSCCLPFSQALIKAL